MTYTEIILWNHLKQKKMLGYDFDRQKPIANYVVDFFCKTLNLAIEVDGITHNSEKAQFKDAARQSELENLGIHFLRVDALDVKRKTDDVLRTIENWIRENKEHPPPPAGTPPKRR